MPILPKHIRYEPDTSRTHSLECGEDYDVLSLNERRYLQPEIIQELKSELYDYIDKTKSNLCLDLTGVEYLASSALNGLLIANKSLERTNRNRLRMINVRPEINEVFIITRINQILDLYDLRRS
ncbi:MAG: STAS domain-containing protein [Candidatus Pacearchaeota archaeon]|jgi:anti-sigma B factor antagonist